jgi:hypothetical protein
MFQTCGTKIRLSGQINVFTVGIANQTVLCWRDSVRVGCYTQQNTEIFSDAPLK